MQKVVPFLWFNDNAEEAINFYVSIFKEFKDHQGRALRATRPGAKGNVTVRTPRKG